MITIAHRELRNNSSDILRRVAEGESFEITNNGKVVAELVPPSALSALAGVTYRPARVRGGFDAIERVASSLTSAEIMDDLKGDR